jgi:hypothetical protein
MLARIFGNKKKTAADARAGMEAKYPELARSAAAARGVSMSAGGSADVAKKLEAIRRRAAEDLAAAKEAAEKKRAADAAYQKKQDDQSKEDVAKRIADDRKSVGVMPGSAAPVSFSSQRALELVAKFKQQVAATVSTDPDLRTTDQIRDEEEAKRRATMPVARARAIILEDDDAQPGCFDRLFSRCKSSTATPSTTPKAAGAEAKELSEKDLPKKSNAEVKALIDEILDLSNPAVAALWRNQVWFGAVGGGTGIDGKKVPNCVSKLLNKKDYPEKKGENGLGRFQRLGADSSRDSSYLSSLTSRSFFRTPLLRTDATRDFIQALAAVDQDKPNSSFERIKQWKERVFDPVVKPAPRTSARISL